MSIVRFFKNNVVMTVALIAAVITSFMVLPDKEYLGYFDFKTLTCLFCVLAVVCALKNIRFFYILARKIVEAGGNIRTCVLMLIYITFIGSMLIANDMALLTFLPLGYYVLSTTKMEKYMEVTFILQNIAANLGGMLTPFGNPQNLYLYSFFKIDTFEFVGIMAPCFSLAIVLITLCCIIFIKPEKVILQNLKNTRKGKTTILVAHRITTIEDMDKIIFMDEGQIIDVGTHDELYARCKDYRNMVELQRLNDLESKMN